MIPFIEFKGIIGGPVGGTAPIGGGIEILLAMSVGFAVRKTYTFFQSNTDKKEVF